MRSRVRAVSPTCSDAIANVGGLATRGWETETLHPTTYAPRLLRQSDASSALIGPPTTDSLHRNRLRRDGREDPEQALRTRARPAPRRAREDGGVDLRHEGAGRGGVRGKRRRRQGRRDQAHHGTPEPADHEA